MSQTMMSPMPAKLPIWATIGQGAKRGFRHFWVLVGVMIASYVIIGLLFWSSFANLFAFIAEAQRLTVAGAGDPDAALERAHLIQSMLFSPSMIFFILLSIVVGLALLLLQLRIVALGPGAAFSGNAGAWVHRILLILWRYICAIVIFALVTAAFTGVCLLAVGIGALLAKVLPGFLMGLVGFLFFLAVVIVGAFLIASMYAIGAVSFVGTSCDEHITLRRAYALLKGNRLRAGGVNILLYFIVLVSLFIIITILSLAGVMGVLSAGVNADTAQLAAASVSSIVVMAIAEIAVVVPGAIWWLGVMVAIYQFVAPKGTATSAPAYA